jgi:hypothetical protein
VLLHPGATNSSGVVSTVAKAVQKILQRLHEHEKKRAQDAHNRLVQELPEGEDPPELVLPPQRQLLAGGGSLAAMGMQMSMMQNRGAALSVEPEVDQILTWFQMDSSTDKGAPGKLWDNATWHRPVMDRSKAFTVENPWYGFIAGGHVEELAKATAHDSFGLRQRILTSFGSPEWATLQDIRVACEDLPVQSHVPEDYIAGLLFPVIRWAVSQSSGTEYEADREDGARDTCESNFDEHVEHQRDAFLQPGQHENARTHGKLRTKFDRLTLSLHVAEAIAEKAYVAEAAHTGDGAFDVGQDWCPNFNPGYIIHNSSFLFAYAFGATCENIWKILDFSRKNHVIPVVVDPTEPTQVAGNRAPPTGTVPPVAQKLLDLVPKYKKGTNIDGKLLGLDRNS